MPRCVVNFFDRKPRSLTVFPHRTQMSHQLAKACTTLIPKTHAPVFVLFQWLRKVLARSNGHATIVCASPFFPYCTIIIDGYLLDLLVVNGTGAGLCPCFPEGYSILIINFSSTFSYKTTPKSCKCSPQKLRHDMETFNKFPGLVMQLDVFTTRGSGSWVPVQFSSAQNISWLTPQFSFAVGVASFRATTRLNNSRCHQKKIDIKVGLPDRITQGSNDHLLLSVAQSSRPVISKGTLAWKEATPEFLIVIWPQRANTLKSNTHLMKGPEITITLDLKKRRPKYVLTGLFWHTLSLSLSFHGLCKMMYSMHLYAVRTSSNRSATKARTLEWPCLPKHMSSPVLSCLFFRYLKLKDRRCRATLHHSRSRPSCHPSCWARLNLANFIKLLVVASVHVWKCGASLLSQNLIFVCSHCRAGSTFQWVSSRRAFAMANNKEGLGLRT